MEYIDKYFPAINGDNVDFNLSYDDLVDYIEEEPQVIVSESFDMKPSTVSVKDVSYKIEEIHEFGMPQHPLMVELICTLESLDMRTMFVNDDEVHYVSFARHHEYIADVGPLIYGGDYVDNITFPDINDHWLKASLLKTVGVYDPTVGVIAANNVSSICHAARERIEGKEGIFFLYIRGEDGSLFVGIIVELDIMVWVDIVPGIRWMSSVLIGYCGDIARLLLFICRNLGIPSILI